MPRVPRFTCKVLRGGFLPGLLVAVAVAGAGASLRAQTMSERVEAALSGPPPEVLVINSYAPGYRWSDDMLAGVTAVLQRHYKDIEPVIIFLDARRFPEPEREAWLLADIEHKVARRPPALVVTLDNPAFDFALRHRDRIAPGVPLVFGGLNRFLPEMIAGQTAITGVSEETDFSGTFELIASLRPQARRVLAVSNRSASAVESRRLFEGFVPRYAERYAFEFFDTWTNDELFARLASLGTEWVVVILDATRDADGRDNYNSTAFYEAMSTRPAVPVFVNSRPPGARDVATEPWDTIGGGLVVADLHGAAVGALAVRILGGEDAGSVPVVRYSPQQLEVEYTQMRRFGLRLDALPPGTRVNNAPAAYFRVNRSRIVLVIALVLLLCGIILVLSLNILWRRRAEHALRRAEEHLRAAQKLEAVGLLAGGVAHDFNNILQVIRGHAGFLREAVATVGGTAAEDVQVIEDAAERATRLTRQLLAFGRRQTLKVGPVDPAALVQEMVSLLRRVLGEHIELKVVPPEEPCTLLADRSQLEQVLLNLCVNARDAMPSGGRIRIELRRIDIAARDLTEFSELKPGPHVVLTVSDNGAGMSPEVRRHIFEPFFSTKPVGKGTGLGLAVVYGIVRQHEGAVRVYSEVGQGTAFRITLPIRTNGHAVEPARAKDALPAGRGTILLAEDDAQVRALGERILHRQGYRVLAARDGREALDLIEAHGAGLRLAVLDVIMPRLSGRQVFEALRQRHPEVPVLFCSGYSADMLPPEIAPDGDFALLNKPYTDRELLEHVQRLLGA